MDNELRVTAEQMDEHAERHQLMEIAQAIGARFEPDWSVARLIEAIQVAERGARYG